MIKSNYFFVSGVTYIFLIHVAACITVHDVQNVMLLSHVIAEIFIKKVRNYKWNLNTLYVGNRRNYICIGNKVRFSVLESVVSILLFILETFCIMVIASVYRVGKIACDYAIPGLILTVEKNSLCNPCLLLYPESGVKTKFKHHLFFSKNSRS